jgi:hypothetical protein
LTASTARTQTEIAAGQKDLLGRELSTPTEILLAAEDLPKPPDARFTSEVSREVRSTVKWLGSCMDVRITGP